MRHEVEHFGPPVALVNLEAVLTEIQRENDRAERLVASSERANQITFGLMVVNLTLLAFWLVVNFF